MKITFLMIRQSVLIRLKRWDNRCCPSVQRYLTTFLQHHSDLCPFSIGNEQLFISYRHWCQCSFPHSHTIFVMPLRGFFLCSMVRSLAFCLIWWAHFFMMKDKPNTNTNKHRTTCFGGGGGDVSTFREVGFEICALYRLYGTHYSHYFTVSLHNHAHRPSLFLWR